MLANPISARSEEKKENDKEKNFAGHRSLGKSVKGF